MEIYELTPATQNKRQWKRRGYGVCGLDEAGNTYFNPAAIGPLAVLLALSDGLQVAVRQRAAACIGCLGQRNLPGFGRRS